MCPTQKQDVIGSTTFDTSSRCQCVNTKLHTEWGVLHWGIEEVVLQDLASFSSIAQAMYPTCFSAYLQQLSLMHSFEEQAAEHEL